MSYLKASALGMEYDDYLQERFGDTPQFNEDLAVGKPVRGSRIVEDENSQKVIVDEDE